MPRASTLISRRRLFAAAAGLTLAEETGARASPLAPLLGAGAGVGVFDHTAFDALLAKFARKAPDGVVRVDYAGWSQSAADRNSLRRYLAALAGVDPRTLSRGEQFAFWANLYNAATLNVVLAAFPVSSIRDIRPNFLAFGPWNQTVARIAGVDLSLDAIERDILRQAWRDPRVHYALNCASMGCPNLTLRAWRGADLSTTLDAAARAYVNHPRGAHFEGEALVVSSIYRWYAADFGGSDLSIIRHLMIYADAPLRQQLARTTRIARTGYDWSLNAASGRS